MKKFSAEFLLIDIGNTNTKLRLASRERLLFRTRRLSSAQLSESGTAGKLRLALQGWHWQRVVLASVVPAGAAAAVQLLGEPILHVNARLDIGVDLRGYPGRRTLGADRLADLAGAWALGGSGPLIVADLGTAAVFNAIDAHGAFLGGVIAPGLAALHGSLPARTAQLPLVKLRAPSRVLGRTTRQALLAGAVYGYRGVIREILTALRAELGSARLVATGGDVHLLDGLTTEKDLVSPELTLEGLRVIAGRNTAGSAAP